MNLRSHYGFVILALAVLTVFCALGLGRFGYGMVLPAMQEQLGMTNTQTGALQSWNLVGYVVTVGLTGALAVHYGPRRVMTLALLVVGLAMLATGLASGFGGVAIGRFFAGVGGAAANVPAMGLITAWFAARHRGVATGIGVTGSSLGLIVTGPLVPVLLHRWGASGWRVCWLVFGGFALAACVVCAFLVRNHPEEKGLGLVGDGPLPPSLRSATRTRLDWGAVYRSRYLWQLATVYFAFGLSYIIYSTFFVKHLVRDIGMTTDAAGALWLKVGLVSTVSGFLWGTISDRCGRRFSLGAIFVLQGIAFLSMGATSARWGILLSAWLFALTAWSIPAIVAAMAADSFGTRLAPAALGVATIVFGLGQALGPYLAGMLADRTGSFAAAFLLAGGVALVLGAGGTLLLPRAVHFVPPRPLSSSSS